MKYLMDIVHGSISVRGQEVEIMDHMLFQRLRYIKQSDILHLTFMGATHTRFSHSLGVMHMGSKVFDMLFELEGQASNPDYLEASLYLKKVLRMALMLHDTGHAAFSHLIESLPSLREAVYSKDRTSFLWSGVEDEDVVKVINRVNEDRIYHEDFSIRVAYQIMSDIGLQKHEIWDVISIMEGFPSEKMSDMFDGHASSVIGEISQGLVTGQSASVNARQILHFILSSEFDADKLDYLRRDSFHAGVGYGAHDVEGLVNSFKLIHDREENRVVVTVSQSGLASACDMVEARYKLYSHIHNHTGNNGSEVIFAKAINEVFSNPSMKAKVINRMSSMDGFRFFTDDVIMSMLSDIAMDNPDSYCSLFLKRKRATHLATFRTHQDCNIDEAIAELKEKYGEDSISVSVKKIKFSCVDENYRDLMVRVKSSEGGWGLKSMTELTSFFNSRSCFTQYGCYLT